MTLDWKEFHSKVTRLSQEKGLPLSGAFELTSRCNFRCKMCYVACSAGNKAAAEKELTAGQWIELGRQARDAGMFYLILTGGEVFLRKDFEKIYESLSEMGLNITIFTNASLITPEKARWLGRIPPQRVSVTVYGGSPETYEKVTGNRDGYIRTMRALEILKAENIRLEIKTTVVEANHRDYKELYDIAHTYSNVLGVVNYISPRREGTGSDPAGNRLSPVDIVEYENRISLYGQRLYPKNKKLEIKINEDTANEDTAEGKKAADGPELLPERSAFRCQAGKSGFWLTWDGRMIPCGLLDTPCARPLETGFVNAWEALKEGCRTVPQCIECHMCNMREQCISCPGRLKAETGGFTKPAGYLCESARHRLALSREKPPGAGKIAR